jgi:hypothetical protein
LGLEVDDGNLELLGLVGLLIDTLVGLLLVSLQVPGEVIKQLAGIPPIDPL